MKIVEITIVCVILLIVAYAVCGCQQHQTKVWGKGDTTAEWKEYFGNDNTARLDYVQTNSINNLGQAVAELQVKIEELESEGAKE